MMSAPGSARSRARRQPERWRRRDRGSTPASAPNDVEDIVARLAAAKNDAAQAALATMQKMSPTSLKVTLRNVRDAASFKRLEESFQQDYRIALACIAGHDFIEGIRAQIVDKDRNPRWRPDTLEGVTPDIVDRHFKSVGDAGISSFAD